MQKRAWLIASVVVLLVAVLVAGWFVRPWTSGPIPRAYRKGLDFALYYPTRLPPGYSVDQHSFKRQGTVLIFSIAAPNGKNIAASEQALPINGPAHQATAAPVQIPGEKHFTTSIGDAHISLWGDKYVSDVITDQTWLILNVTGFTADEATAITQSFTKL